MFADTIRTTFTESGGAFDIVQDVYPVAFRASGQIVLSVKIVNHTTSLIGVDGLQWLNDLEATSGSNGNDNPYVIERNYYDGQKWRVASKDGTSPNPPSFYIETQGNPSSLNLGTMGCGFTNDSFPPQPMGLTPCSAFAVGSWEGGTNSQLLDYIYGCPPPPSPNITNDMACVLQWPPKSVPAARPNADTTIEEFRTSFGTQEFCMCLGNAMSINVYPSHSKYDAKSRRYASNPFPALSMILNIQGSAFTNVRANHTVVSPLQIVRGGSIATDGLSSSYSGATIKPGEMQTFLWIDSSTIAGGGRAVAMNFDMAATGYSGTWDCGQPGSQNGACDIMIDPVGIVFARHILSRTGSYDKSPCNARKTTIQVYDSGGLPTISRIDYTAENMTVSFPPWTGPLDTVTYSVQVVDSMLDGIVTFIMSDDFHDIFYDTVRYCTIADTVAPSITLFKTPPHVYLTDSAAWDRGIDSFYFVDSNQHHHLDFKVACDLTANFTVGIDSPWTFGWTLHVKDCAGNASVLPFFNTPSLVRTDHSQFAVFPNPISDDLTIDPSNNSPQFATIQDLLGRTVANFTVTGITRYDLSALTPSTYILHIGNTVRRIIKR